MATEVRHDQLVLLWEPPPRADIVDSYTILAQVGGAGGHDGEAAVAVGDHRQLPRQSLTIYCDAAVRISFYL